MNTFGTVIYVGKARDLRKRVSQYYHPSPTRMGLRVQCADRGRPSLDVHLVRSEPEAILLEGKLIKEFQPRSMSASAMISVFSCSR